MELCMNANKKAEKDYYFKPHKFVRDLVLGYVYLTKFDIDIIDTLEFQRLKDIRQLTAQQVFPCARHTRFEHSLGVMELTRRAIKDLNNNGFISEHIFENTKILDDQILFNASLSALLHDIGHCPFSHLGETEFDKIDVWNRLYNDIKVFPELKDSGLRKEFDNINNSKNKIDKIKCATHELLSCIIILEKIGEKLLAVKEYEVKLENDSKSILYVDFELVIRSILGIPYNVSTLKSFKKNKGKNVIINLINSKAFDMDKLDYIMRDSLFTGIGAPKIDTHRLFKNMYLFSQNDYSVVFTNRAVPALQNLIESRDELYMYVYNHHTAVFSDFMNSYIFRRLAHNERDFVNLIWTFASEKINMQVFNKEHPIVNIRNLKKEFTDIYDPVMHLGIVSKDYLFSPDAIIEQKRSDSDLTSLLTVLRYSLFSEKKDLLTKLFIGEIDSQLKYVEINMSNKLFEDLCQKNENKINKLCGNCIRIYKLIDCYLKRAYLKPWWKTISEFSNFINNNFRDDRIRNELCDWICGENDRKSTSAEFCSQLAKNVSFISRKVFENNNQADLIMPLETDEFFVIPRSTRFFDPETISRFYIALKSNEIIGSPKNVEFRIGDYYIKKLTNVIPQRDYYSMYAKNSFFIFSKPLPDENKEEKEYTPEQRSKHYRFIEQIFVFVATTLINEGVRKFQDNYIGISSDKYKSDDATKKKEKAAHNKMYGDFKKFYSM